MGKGVNRGAEICLGFSLFFSLKSLSTFIQKQKRTLAPLFMPYVLRFCAYSSKASILIFCILEEPFIHSDDIYVEKENVDK